MAVNRRGSERDSDFNQPFERSPYAIPIGENRSPSSQASVGRQRISREEGRQRKYLRNLENQKISRTNSIGKIREIREEFNEYREELKLRAADERGKVSEGLIYDSVQYQEPNKNNTNPDSKSTQGASVPGVDSISGEEAPGDSQGDNLTDDPDEPKPFLETAVTICINGTPTTGTIYFRSD